MHFQLKKYSVKAGFQLYYQGRKTHNHFAICMASAGNLFPTCCQARGSVSRTVMTDVELPFLVLFPQVI